MGASAELIDLSINLGPDRTIFQDPFVKPRFPSRSVAVSAVAHCAFFLLLPYLTTLSLLYEEPRLKLYVTSIEPLTVRIPEPLFFRARTPSPSPKPDRAAAPSPAGPRLNLPDPPKLQAPQPGPGPSVVLARKFELPPVPRPKLVSPQIILQPPDAAVNVPVQALPKVLAWRQNLELPRPKPRTFVVTPGRPQTAPDKPPELVAPPSLDVPNRSSAVSDVNAMPSPERLGPLHLVLPPSRTVPLRALEPAPAPEITSVPAGAIASAVGDASNLIILSASVPNLKEPVPVPPGSTATEIGRGGGTGTGAGGGITRTRERTPGTGSGNGTSPGGTGEGRGAGSSAGPNGGTISIASSDGPNPYAAPPPPARLLPPKIGTFDIVVVQSAGTQELFRAVGVLKGKPIYTVYLQLGLPKAWILQYCLTVNKSVPATDDIVQLDESTPVTPPYPITTVLSELELQPKSSYTLIHGYLTVTGRFRNLTLVGSPDKQTNHLLPLLEKWEFRPAMKDHKPIEVETLLAIPPVPM